MLCMLFGALAVMGAYSIHLHINCGMVGMARYNAWFFPIIALGTVYYMDISFSGVAARRICSGLTALSCIWCVFIMGVTAYSPHGSAFYNHVWWSPVAETVLEYAPGLYDPLPSTFHCRTDHIDGAYDIPEPVIYANGDGYVRKVLVPPGMLDQAVQQLAVPEEDQTAFDKQCAKVKRDDRYYYLDFPAGSHIRKFALYELGTVVSFDGTEEDAHKYFLHGVSYTEGNTYAWTDGNAAELCMRLETVPEKDLLLRLHMGYVYHAPQRMTVRSGGTVLFDEGITDASAPVDIVIPAACTEDQTVDLTFEFPDAVSPKEMGESVDTRELAFEIRSFCLVDEG